MILQITGASVHCVTDGGDNCDILLHADTMLKDASLVISDETFGEKKAKLTMPLRNFEIKITEPVSDNIDISDQSSVLDDFLQQFTRSE